MDPDRSLKGACEVEVMGAGSRALFHASERLRVPPKPSTIFLPNASWDRLRDLANFIESFASRSFTSATELREELDCVCSANYENTFDWQFDDLLGPMHFPEVRSP